LRKDLKISRTDLIAKCDDFLNDRIQISGIEKYASDLIFEDFFEWDDEVISDIIFQWDNQEINYAINTTNIKLWKHLLKTDEDLLDEYNQWDIHIEKQKEICNKFQSKWNPINKKLMVGCASELNSNPINGLRHPEEKGTTGWFIWTGDYSDSDDFFKPVCAEHLLQKRPQLIKYLGLDIGHRFLIDEKGYEDIWFDEKLTKLT
jgi:hypothetical protein